MSEFKKQHFLTRKYLKEFSDEKGMVFLFNGNIHKPVPYSSQCQEVFFYSKDKAMEVEGIFSKGEGLLISFIRSVETYLQSELKTAISLTHVIGLFLKSPRIANDTGMERYEAIKNLLTDYLVQIILEEKPSNQALNEIFYGLTIRWRMFLLKIPDGIDEQFITSDSPAILMTDTLGQSPCFSFLPLSEKTAIFFANKEKYFSKESVIEVSKPAIEKLNILTAVNSIQNVYSKKSLKDEQTELFKHGILSDLYKSHDRLYLENNQIKFEHRPIIIDKSVINQFGFLTKNESTVTFLPYKKAQELYKSGKVKVDRAKKELSVHADMNISDLYCATVAEYIDKNPFGS